MATKPEELEERCRPRPRSRCQLCLCSCCGILILISLAEFILAGVVGLALGMGLSPVLLLLAALYVVLLIRPDAERGPKCRILRILLLVLATPLALVCVILFGLHLQTFFNNPGWDSFPESCRVAGCCRLSLSDPRCREGATMPLLITNATAQEVGQEIRRWAEGKINWPEDCRWVDSKPEAYSVPSMGAISGTFAWVSCSTSAWRFVDDIAWRYGAVTCSQDTGVLVEVHSEQRAGMDDGGHNMYRARFSVGHLQQTFGSSRFVDAC